MISKQVVLDAMKGCIVTDYVPRPDGSLTIAFRKDRDEVFPGLTAAIVTFIRDSDDLFVASLALNAKTRVASFIRMAQPSGDSDKAEEA